MRVSCPGASAYGRGAGRVRVDQALLDELDRQLGSNRGPNGELSTTDAIGIGLPTVVDDFAEHFDEFLTAGVSGPGRTRGAVASPA